MRVTAAVVGNSRSEINDLDRLRGPYAASDTQKMEQNGERCHLTSVGRGAGRNLRVVFDLGSNSVTMRCSIRWILGTKSACRQRSLVRRAAVGRAAVY